MKFLKIVLEKKLKGEIAEIKEEGGIFAGLSVMFKDDFGNETWMNENLIEIEKTELVKKAEEYLRRVIQGYTKEEDDESSHSTTPLTEWTLKGDSNA